MEAPPVSIASISASERLGLPSQAASYPDMSSEDHALKESPVAGCCTAEDEEEDWEDAGALFCLGRRDLFPVKLIKEERPVGCVLLALDCGAEGGAAAVPAAGLGDSRAVSDELGALSLASSGTYPSVSILYNGLPTFTYKMKTLGI